MPEYPKFRVRQYSTDHFELQVQNRVGGQWRSCHSFHMDDFKRRLKCYLKFAAERAAQERA